MTRLIAQGTTTTEVGVSIDSWGDLALLWAVPLAVALAAVAVVLLVVRRQEPRDASVADRLRLDFAVLRYDAWLDLRGGVGRRRRRELREELRANLVDATAQVGSREAVRRLGPLRTLAAEAVGGTRPVGRPAWTRGLLFAAYAFGAVLVLELLAVVWWIGGADASGAPTVRGSLALFPGSVVEYSQSADGFALELQPGWLILATTALAFVATSRPWLMSRRDHSTP